MMPSQQDEKRQAAREVIDILHEISTLLVRRAGNYDRGRRITQLRISKRDAYHGVEYSSRQSFALFMCFSN